LFQFTLTSTDNVPHQSSSKAISLFFQRSISHTKGVRLPTIAQDQTGAVVAQASFTTVDCILVSQLALRIISQLSASIVITQLPESSVNCNNPGIKPQIEALFQVIYLLVESLKTTYQYIVLEALSIAQLSKYFGAFPDRVKTNCSISTTDPDTLTSHVAEKGQLV